MRLKDGTDSVPAIGIATSVRVTVYWPVSRSTGGGAYLCNRVGGRADAAVVADVLDRHRFARPGGVRAAVEDGAQ